MSGSPVFRITRDGNSMFIGGSVHVLRETDFPLPEAFDYAFSASDALVLETDLDQMETPEALRYLSENMYLPSGKTLRTILSPQVYQALNLVCLEYGLPIALLESMKPSVVMNTLAVLQIESHGFGQLGVDYYYFEKAKEQNKPVVFLESVQTQINAIVSMGEGYEDEYVMYSLADMEETEEGIKTLVYEWRNGITSGTEESLAEMYNSWPQIYKTMITDRHDAWFPQIDKFLASGRTYFIIVGYMHLPGFYGLLQYLEDAGCVIEQITAGR